MNEMLLVEFEKCLSLWEKQGFCTFGGKTQCENCASLYLLWKMLTGEIIHGENSKLTLSDWREKLTKIKNIG